MYYGNDHKKTTTVESFCDKCISNFEDWGIEVSYPEFKQLERLGFKSIKNSYNKFDKTIYVKGKEAVRNASYIVDSAYAKMLRTLIPGLGNEELKSDFEAAAQKISPILKGYRKHYPVEELEEMVDQIKSPKQHMDKIVARVSNVLGKNVSKKYIKYDFGKPKPYAPAKGLRKIITKTTKTKTTKPKASTAKNTSKRKVIKGQPGYSQVTKTKKGYCVPETKQHYWKRL